MFEGRKVSDRIVSIDRYYVCPIVRGKETKSVKFGAKVNNIQIDGISFIEHLSFKAFNECIRLKDCIRMQQKLMNVRVKRVAADPYMPIMPTESSVQNMGYPHPLCAREERQKMSL